MKQVSLTVVAILALTACGQHKGSDKAKSPAVQSAAEDAAPGGTAKTANQTEKSDTANNDEQVAKMLVVRTSVDANGEESLDSAETVALTETVSIQNGNEAEDAYGKGKPVDYGPGQNPGQTPGQYVPGKDDNYVPVKGGTEGPGQYGPDPYGPAQAGYGNGCNCGDRRYEYWNTPWYPGKLLGRGLTWGRNPWVSYGGNDYQYSYGNRYFFGGYYYRYYTL